MGESEGKTMSKYQTRAQRAKLLSSLWMGFVISAAVLLMLMCVVIMIFALWDAGAGWLSALLVAIPVAFGLGWLWVRAGKPDKPVTPYVADWDWEE